MPQEQEVTQQATDPKANPLAFVYENRQALANMKPSLVEKGAAALTGGGAGVLGGVRAFSEFIAKMDKTNLAKDPIHQAISKAEGKAYEEAQALDPKMASRSAAVGH